MEEVNDHLRVHTMALTDSEHKAVQATLSKLRSPLPERNVLDHGKVVLIDTFGSDARICEAAGVSYQKGTKRNSTDQQLIRYLMRHRHTSPFEMCEVLFYLKMPIFVARQHVRHRTASLNEVSARYSELPAEYYVPEVSALAPQSTMNKQGRDGKLDEIKAQHARQKMQRGQKDSFELYDSLLNVSELARELARIPLPLGTYTEMYWKIDLHNFLHFLKLRRDPHAQLEIRVYADAMYELIKPIFPLVCEAAEDYIFNARTLSALDIEVLSCVLTGRDMSTIKAKMSKREWTELSEWLETLT